MNTISDRQIDANRRNAQHSTGPKTAEGKARSRRNALKHGLAAGEILVSESEKAALTEAIETWNHEVWPENVAERAIIRRMAVSDIRLRRCEAAEDGSLESAAREAVSRWRERKQAAARKKAMRLRSDPLNTLLDLEDSAFGCDWLSRRWTALDRILEQGLGWSEADRNTAMTLIGFLPLAPGPDASPEAILWHRLALLAADPPTDPAIGTRPSDRTPASARAQLRELIAERLDRLDDLAAEAWKRVDGPERDAVIARSLAADDSREGQLRQRYDRDSQNALLRCVSALIRIRKRRDELDEKHRRETREAQPHLNNLGGGWYSRDHADPAPPGFQRIPLVPYTPAAPAASPERSATVPTPNEPISPTVPPTNPNRNRFDSNEFRDESSGPPGPRPDRSRPVPKPPADRSDPNPQA